MKGFVGLAIAALILNVLLYAGLFIGACLIIKVVFFS